MATRHLIADGELSLLGDIAADNFVYAGRQLVAVLLGEYFDIDNDAVFAVGPFQGSISDFLGFLAEYRAEQSLLGGQLGLALGRYLADKYIAGVNLCADADYASVVKVAKGVLADVGDISGYLFGAELGVSGLSLIFLDMDRGVNVVSDELLIDKNGVLVVVAFPCHEADKGVFAEAQLAVVDSGAVCDDLVLLDSLTDGNYRALVGAGALVGAHELDKLIVPACAAVLKDINAVGRNLGDYAALFGEHDGAGVNGSLIFHTGADDGGFGLEKRNSLLLHVGAHQRTVCIVVLKERDKSRCNRNDHLGRNVHVIGLGVVDLKEFVSVPCGDLLSDEAVILIEGLVRLGDDVLILGIGGHVLDLVEHHAGLFIYLSERSFDEAVFIDLGECCKIGDKADVGAFGGLYRAHTSVVRIMNVADLESGSVS